MKTVMMCVWCLAVGVAVAAPTGVKVNGVDVGDGSGAGWTYSAGVVTLTGGGPYVLSGSNTTGAVRFALDGSMDVTLRDLTLACAAEGACCLKAAKAGTDVTLRLAGASTLDASAGGEGLCVDNGARLTISAASGSSDENAVLNARGGEGCAAISVGTSGGSRLEIAGGTVRANWVDEPKDYSVGIGTSFDWSGEYGTSTIVISGGRVFARGEAYEPGIGAVDWTQSGAPDIRISGGYVEAEGGVGAAGIGGGVGGQYGSATVSGGTVVATGGDEGYPDVLAGSEATGGGGFAITGGNVVLANLATAAPDPAPTNANGRALWCVTVDLREEGESGSEEIWIDGIEGYGCENVRTADGRLCLWLPNGEHAFTVETRNESFRCAATVVDANMTAEVRRTLLGVTVNGVDVGSGSGEGWHYDMRSHYVEVTEGGSYVLSGMNTEGAVMFAIDADAQVTLSNLCLRCTTVGECCLWATNNVDVTIFLAGTNTLDASKGDDDMGEGLCIENGARLTITNALGFTDADAVLVAKGSYNRAAIAVGRNGTVGLRPYFEIAGGTILANWESPANWSAGIGASYKTGKNGEADIVISGGRVFAKGGAWDPGIGAADNESKGVPDIRITGGYVEAEGGYKSAGIGGGWRGRYGNAMVSGGTVKVTGGELASDMLAGNEEKGGGGFAVTGGNVCLTRLATVDPNPAPTNALGQRVWCVTVESEELRVKSEELVEITGLEGYGTKDIVPVDGKVYLWLPNGEHRFVINGRAAYHATVDGANVVATPSIPYRAWNETTRRMEDFWCADCTIVTADTATFQDGKWYAVTGTVSRGTITVNGTAHLILCDGAKLIADGGASEAGVCVVSGNALAVYGQAEGTGALTATGSENAAGIGGGWGGSCGTVTIDGGTVTATGREFGAGIGGGIGGSGGAVTINGGTVTATGDVGAGIGSGYGNGNDPTGGTITINGGKVTATGVGAGVGAGIGGGDWCGSTGNIRITGGTVVASTTVLDGNASQDVGYGNMGQVGSGSIEIVGGSVRAVNDRVEPAPSNGTERVWCVTVEGLDGLEGPASLEGLEGYGVRDIVPVDGKVYLWLPNGEHRFVVNGRAHYCATVDDANAVATPMIPYRAWNETTRQMEDRECADFTVVTADTATFADGKWYAVIGTVSRGPITVNGSAHLILCDGASLTATGDGLNADAGVYVNSGNVLAIYGQAEGSGALTATGNSYGAGIGGGFISSGKSGAAGTVTINGGTVTAAGGGGAGIGGGWGGSGGTVTINGGKVVASSSGSGAGIGSGYGNGNNPTGGTITINGGKVVASSTGVGAGIGGGVGCGSSGIVRITGGTVVASTKIDKAEYTNLDIGHGNVGQVGSGSIEIVGGSVRAVNDRVEPAPSNGTERVWCVTVESEELRVKSEELVEITGLEGYGTKDIVPIDGKMYLWLPNGEYRFFVRSAEGVGCYEAVVRDANVTATKITALPVSPGKPIGPYDTTLAATNALGAAVFTPAPAVAEVLTSDGARTDYAANFGFVVTGGDGAWYVSAALTPAAEAKLAASAASVTTNLNLVAIAALPAEGTANLALKGGVLGFYYTLCSAAEVRILPDGGAQYGPVLCESADGEVVFPNVKKPSGTAGFFTVRVRESAE